MPALPAVELPRGDGRVLPRCDPVVSARPSSALLPKGKRA